MPVKFSPHLSHILDRPERRTIIDPMRILNCIRLQEAMYFGDMGCGTGYFSLPAAEIVARRGVVFAIDIEQQMLSVLAERAVNRRCDNLRLVLSTENSIPLPDEILDLALVANVLPELLDPQAFFAEIARLLIPSGTVAVLDWHKRPMKEGPAQEIRIGEHEASAICASGPLLLLRRFVPGPCHYGLILRRRQR